LYQILAQLATFTDIKPYGQLVSRIAGMATYDLWVQVPCIVDGWNKGDWMGFYSMGKCAGALGSQLFDAMF
jgi:hypothetical protein